MGNLDKLKDIWQNQKESTIQFTESDINKMVHKKSSSIVKWILIISILEFLLPNIFLLFTDFESTKEVYQDYGLSNLVLFYSIVHVLVILGFIYLFYKNYKNIHAECSVKKLLQSILKTRKTVKYYVYYNLIMAAIIGVHMFYLIFNSQIFIEKLPENVSMLAVWSISLVILSIAVLLFWLVYRLIYGVLLNRLQKNYIELQK